MLTRDEAAEVARREVAGFAGLDGGEPARVAFGGGHYVVTFPRHDPPGFRGPDYDARVVVDAETGAVVEVLWAS